MSFDSLPYDQWIEQALRGVVGQALRHAARYGLPDKHHFYITFGTDAEGVVIEPVLKAQHPKEMTIVLQHQFWDLNVEDDAFAVTLKFHGRQQRLFVPFTAITAFGDPSVNFGLQLHRLESQSPDDAEGLNAGADGLGASADVAGAASVGGDADSSKDDRGRVVALDNFRKK